MRRMRENRVPEDSKRTRKHERRSIDRALEVPIFVSLPSADHTQFIMSDHATLFVGIITYIHEQL